MTRTRRNHEATIKAQATLSSAVNVDKTLATLTKQFQIHSIQITKWKQQLLARAGDMLSEANPPTLAPDLKTLHAKIGQPTLENDVLPEGSPRRACGVLSHDPSDSSTARAADNGNC